MKQKLSMLLILTLLLSLFAGCTPADVPSTGDPSVDASVTDSNASDTSSSETDAITSETNTDASTDTSTDSATTDIYTNIGTSTDANSSQETVEPLVKGSSLTNAEIGSIVSKIVFGETTVSDVDKLLGKTNVFVPSGKGAYLWEFENYSILCYVYDMPTHTYRVSRICLLPQKGHTFVEKDVRELLLAIGIDAKSESCTEDHSSVPQWGEEISVYTYVQQTVQGERSVKVSYLKYKEPVDGRSPEVIGIPYLRDFQIRPTSESD